VAETTLDHRSVSALARELGRSFTGDVLTAGDAYGGQERCDRLASVKVDCDLPRQLLPLEQRGHSTWRRADHCRQT
jgi:hypothetical protein